MGAGSPLPSFRPGPPASRVDPRPGPATGAPYNVHMLATCSLLPLLLPTPVAPPVQDPVPVISPEDYVYCYWPTNFRPWPTWPAFRKVRHVSAGTYGLVFDTAAGDLLHMGRLAAPPGGAEEALHAENSTLEALPTSTASYSVTLDGVDHTADGFLGSGGSADIPGRLIDGGRFMNRLDIPEVSYSGAPDLAGSIVLAAMPRHFALTQRAEVPAGGAASAAIHVHLGGAALTGLSTTAPVAGGRGLRMTDATGEGWVFLVPEVPGTTASVTVDASGGITATRSHGAAAAGDELAVSILAMRTEGLSAAQLDAYVDPGANVQVRYAQQDRQGQLVETLADATFEPERGVFLVELDLLTNVGAPTWPTWSDPSHQTWYNRHRIVLESTAAESVSIPIAFDMEADVIASITGGCAMLRDLDGEPLGVPVQISKNWHETTSPRRWYHFYSTPLLPAGGTHELEFTVASGSWGSCFAASHAQLSLIGWGQDQQWDESALGCWGESITYDPDLTLQRSMLDDVRPFLTQSQSQYNWSGNVGGGDFFTYRAPNGSRDRLVRLRSHYAAQGPNLTDVTYAGRTHDGRVSATVRTRLGRTDDVVRAYYDLEYEFHDTVSYSRLAFFQIAADNYSDNDFQHIAYGNADAVVYDQPAAPTGSAGYASAADRGIALQGDAPWVLLYDNQKMETLREDVACVGFVVRDYEFTSGGTTTTTPHVNLVNTNNWNQYPEVGFELGVPYDPSSATVPAGSVLRATIEYLVMPDDKALYYGPSADLLALPASTFGTAEMMRVLAASNRQDVLASVGTLNRTHPIDITCEGSSALAAQFSLDQGFGHVAVVLRGLDRHDGWQLQREEAGGWVPLGQEVEGNDYWQCRLDEVAGSYELTFNVEHDGAAAYRLIRIDCDDDGVLDAGQLAADPTLDLDGNLVLDRCEAVGVTYCSPNTPNSTGASGEMTALGSAEVARNDLRITARQLPASAFGFFITSTTPGSVFPVANSQGTLCIIGNIGRGAGGGIINSGPLGVLDGQVDLTAVPQPTGPVAVLPGDTWHFQAWHRDATGGQTTSNFTDAVAVTFE